MATTTDIQQTEGIYKVWTVVGEDEYGSSVVWHSDKPTTLVANGLIHHTIEEARESAADMRREIRGDGVELANLIEAATTWLENRP